MQFLLIIAHDAHFVPTDGLIEQIGSWIEHMTARGIRLAGCPLRPASEATTLRVRDGHVHRTATTFSDSAEQMCAY